MNYYQLIVKGSAEEGILEAGTRLPGFLLVKTRPFRHGEANLVISTEEGRTAFETGLIGWYHWDDSWVGFTPAPKGTLLWWKKITPRQAGRD